MAHPAIVIKRDPGQSFCWCTNVQNVASNFSKLICSEYVVTNNGVQNVASILLSYYVQ